MNMTIVNSIKKSDDEGKLVDLPPPESDGEKYYSVRSRHY